MSSKPKRHLLDRRAEELQEKFEANPDDFYDTTTLAKMTGTSKPFWEIGRHMGYGPKFIRLGPNTIRYAKSDVLAWLEERKHLCASEYMEAAE